MGYDAVVDSARFDGALTATAEAIRSKLESKEPIAFDMDTGFKSAVETIETGGNTEAAYNEGVEAGKQAQYDEFWANANLAGMQYDSVGRFAGGTWRDATFNPPYPLSIGANCNYLFYACSCTTLLGKVEKIAPVSAMYMFQHSAIKHITVVDLSNPIKSFELSLSFASGKIVTIALLISSEKTMWNNNTFQDATALENMIFDGVIGQNGLNLQWSTKLNKASITSIINCLSTTTSGLTVTLSKTAKENAFTAEEWSTLIGARSNWTISLV